jgi:hypothetical protein
VPSSSGSSNPRRVANWEAGMRLIGMGPENAKGQCGCQANGMVVTYTEQDLSVLAGMFLA